MQHIIAARRCGDWGDRYARIRPEHIEDLVVLTELSFPIGDSGQEVDPLLLHPKTPLYTHIGRAKVRGEGVTIAIDLADDDTGGA